MNFAAMKGSNSSIKLDVVTSLVVFGLFFTLYLGFRSPFLDDFDSINFALALRDYNLMEAQPHPPGYPIYIWVGRALRPFFASDAETLSLISALCSAFALICFFFLARRWVCRTLAFLGALVLGSTPGWALDSLKALTDLPGLFALIVFVLAVTHLSDTKQIASRAWRWLGVWGVAVGLVGGVRLHIEGILLLFCFHWFGVRSAKHAVSLLLGVIVGTLLWVLPVVWSLSAAHFFKSYWLMITARWGQKHWSVLGSQPSLDWYVVRLLEFMDHWISEGLGLAWGEFTVSTVLAAIGWLGLVYCTVRFAAPSADRNAEKLDTYRRLEKSLLWALGLYAVFVFIYLPPMNARYLLPLLPFFLLGGLIRLESVPRIGACALLAILAGANFSISNNLVRVLTSVPPAPQQLISEMQKWDLSTERDTAIVSSRYFAYYPIDCDVRLGRLTTCEQIREWVQQGRRVWIEEPRQCAGVRYEQVAQFHRPRQVHYKAHFISLFRVLRQ